MTAAATIATSLTVCGTMGATCAPERKVSAFGVGCSIKAVSVKSSLLVACDPWREIHGFEGFNLGGFDPGIVGAEHVPAAAEFQRRLVDLVTGAVEDDRVVQHQALRQRRRALALK